MIVYNEVEGTAERCSSPNHYHQYNKEKISLVGTLN